MAVRTFDCRISYLWTSRQQSKVPQPLKMLNACVRHLSPVDCQALQARNRTMNSNPASATSVRTSDDLRISLALQSPYTVKECDHRR